MPQQCEMIRFRDTRRASLTEKRSLFRLPKPVFIPYTLGAFAPACSSRAIHARDSSICGLAESARVAFAPLLTRSSCSSVSERPSIEIATGTYRVTLFFSTISGCHPCSVRTTFVVAAMVADSTIETFSICGWAITPISGTLRGLAPPVCGTFSLS